MLQRVNTPSTLLIAGVEGIYVGPGLGRKGGNARIGAEKGGIQYTLFSDVGVSAGSIQYTL